MNKSNWLTVDEASLHCQQMGLNRSKKTMRRWAQHREVEAKKQTMQKGMRWLINQLSLETKIQEELEFQKQQQAANSRPAPIGEQGSDMRAHDHSQADMSGHKRSQPDSERPKADMAAQEEIRTLEAKVMELTIDVRWRSQALGQLKKDIEKMQENLQGQARYIGHLESDLMHLGGKPNEQFLAAPTVGRKEVGEEQFLHPQMLDANRPHPDQQNLATG